MKTKGKYKLFKLATSWKGGKEYWYGRYRKFFLARKTCRYQKHKGANQEFKED